MYQILIFLTFSIVISNNLIAQIQLLNDEFENQETLNANWLNINEVEQWNAEHLEVHDIDNSTPGKLHMMPWTSSWFANYRGTLIYKTIENDFIFTINVTATNRASTDMPGGLYALAGMMIRAPRNYPNGATGAGGWTPNGENYIFLAAGFASSSHPSCSGSCPGPHFEIKNTVNGNSALEVSAISTYENINLRLARIGDAIIVLSQLPGENWEIRARYNRSDFPPEIQMGFVTYSDWSKVSSYDPYFHNSNVLNDDLNPDPSNNPGLDFNPDLIGEFDFARYDNVELPIALENVDLVNEATDEELLDFLDFNTEEFCPNDIHIEDTITQNQIASMYSSGIITADNLIEINSSMTYSATNSIELLIGFESTLGAELMVEVLGCP